jgi:peptidoglycan/xylan/chitin deacetylase (PgdA/CDA1 family)
MWHRFGPATTDRVVGVDLFESQMALLRTRFDVVSASELCAAKTQGRLRRNMITVTVDDGYEDFYHYALPILCRYQIPATLYATTGFIDRRLWLWPDFLRYAIENTTKNAIECDLGGAPQVIDLSDPAAREQAWSTLADHALTLESSASDRFVRMIVDELKTAVPNTPTQAFGALTWNQLRDIASAGIEIGGHSCTHPAMTMCSTAQIEHEAAGSKQELENQLQRPVTSFAYPFGICNETVRQFVRKAGYLGATSTTGTDYRIHDVFDIKRFGSGHDIVSFRNAAYGVHFMADRLGRQI